MNKKIKLLLAGTPDFSVPIFKKLIDDFEVVGIISQPDRPANRGYKLEPTPTKILANQNNIKLFQPNKIGEIKEDLATLNFDFLITAAFGQYIPTYILEMPKVAAINIHGSLLPKYRGAAPIQYSILNGDKEIGITLIYMTKEMDAGDMLAKASVEIDESITSKEAFSLLSELATNNISQWVKDLYEGKLTPIKQDEALVTFSPKIPKEDAQIFLSDSCESTINKIRSLNDNPGAFFIDENGKRVKLFRASRSEIKNAYKLKLQDGIIYVYEYQYEGKKKVNVITN